MAIHFCVSQSIYNSKFLLCLIWILNSVLLKYTTVMAELRMIPELNVNHQNYSESCLLDMDHISGKVVHTLSSISFQTCTIRLLNSADIAALIEVPPRTTSDVFLLAERKGELPNCKNRYVVIKYGSVPCTSIFRHPDLQLSLQGNVSVKISEIPVDSSVPLCPVNGINEQLFPDITLCVSEEFNHQITCTLSSKRVCSFEFPANCNASLGHRYVEFQCQDNDVVSKTSYRIVYPSGTITLNLKKHNIININENHFQNLDLLKQLILDNNKLSFLPPAVFHNLKYLNYLSLRRNLFVTLDVALFKSLERLTRLRLHNNELEKLPVNIFDNLSSLNEIDLGQNNLVEIPKEALSSVPNLAFIFLDNNQIISVDTNLFNNTTELLNLTLSSNKLTVVPRELLKGLTNLDRLYLRKNQITSLDKDVFKENSKLTYLSLSDNMLKALPNGLFDSLVNLEQLLLDGNVLTFLDDNLFITNTKLLLLQLHGNILSEVSKMSLQGLEELKSLTIDGNRLKTLPKPLFRGLKNIDTLSLRKNQLFSLNSELFRGTSTLRGLILNWNKLVQIPDDIFSGLINLEALALNNNYLKNLSSNIFQGLSNLKVLFLNDNELQTLDFRIFYHTPKLEVLDLAHNKFKAIPNSNDLVNLNYLNLKDNSLTMINKTTFSDLKQVEILVSQTEVCECYVSVNVTCIAVDVRSPYLTCDRLLSDRTLMVMMWLIGLNAIGGNLFVLSRIKTNTRKINVQTILLSNLACADLLMGVYMLLIASADIYFGDYFPMRAENWRSGVTCKIAGTISILSNEASVFFVTLISIDRFINIRFPYTHRKLDQKSSTVIVLVLWVITITLGIVPSFLAGKYSEFYDNSHVCIGLPLAKIENYSKNISKEWFSLKHLDFNYNKYTADSQFLGEVTGMYFSIATFLCLNGICYLIIMFCYMIIVNTVIRSRKSAGRNFELKEQMTLTANVAAIVLTDFLCWFPVILLGTLVQVDVLTLPPSVFAWCVTFVLPINSAINPYLYTISHQIISSYRKRPASQSLDWRKMQNMAEGHRI